MKRSVVLMLALTICAVSSVQASGRVGLYAVIEKVVFEPNERTAERIRIFGAFAFVDQGSRSDGATSEPKRGSLYFSIQPGRSAAERDAIRKEWADFKVVAGTGQAVAFGKWGYGGPFSDVEKGVLADGFKDTLYVLKDGQTNATPVSYVTDSGIVKLPKTGSHAAVVQQLRTLLKK